MNVVFKAGYRALEIVRDEGLNLEQVRVIAGAAGGPKWLVLYQLDRLLITEFFQKLVPPVFLLGSSIGSWRFTTYCTESPLETLDSFFELYMDQRFSLKPSEEEVSFVAREILDNFLSPSDVEYVFKNQLFRLNVFAVRTPWLGGYDNRILLSGYVLMLFLANCIDRRLLGVFMDRVLFADSRNPVPLDLNGDTIPIKLLNLTADNLRAVLLASGSIPLVMNGVRNIPGAAVGTYRDGGLFDYHLDLPYKLGDNELVFFPHYSEDIIPGWFDKRLNRKPSKEHMKNVLLVAPSRTFVEKLPMKKIPDRNDFYFFGTDIDSRKAYWNSVVEMTKQFVDEFAEAILSGKIKDMVKPL